MLAFFYTPPILLSTVHPAQLNRRSLSGSTVALSLTWAFSMIGHYPFLSLADQMESIGNTIRDESGLMLEMGRNINIITYSLSSAYSLLLHTSVPCALPLCPMRRAYRAPTSFSKKTSTFRPIKSKRDLKCPIS